MRRACAWRERGMGGRDFRGHVDELTKDYDIDELKALGGVVDYVVGAQPGPGVFVSRPMTTRSRSTF
jgi:predicted homoserine dehydrogenase-like protein